MAACACVGLLIGPSGRTRAAEPPAGSESEAKAPAGDVHLDLAYIPADAVAAVVVHPRPFLTGPHVDWLPVELITATGLNEAGFDPLKVREGVALFAPPERGPSPEIGLILRFSESYSKESVKTAAFGRETNIDGVEALQVLGPRRFWWCFPDDKTLIGGSEGTIRAMLAAKDVDSPLIELLHRVDVSGQTTAVLSIGGVRLLMKESIAEAPAVSPRWHELLRAPELLSSIILKVDVGKKFKASLTLSARDDASAVETQRIVDNGLGNAHFSTLEQLASEFAGKDWIATADRTYATRIINKIFDLIKTARDGHDVNINFETESGVATAGALVALLLPTVQAVRSAASRNVNVDRMRQIGLAMLNYQAEHKHFPAHAIQSKDGKPLLSWRVAILPQLAEQDLYDQFHLDEPWDSDHNKPLIEKMPAVYAKAGRPDDGKTVFLVPFGHGLAFEGTEGLRNRDFRDGTSHTILAVEASSDRAVSWTKPDDLEVDLSKPLDGLGAAEDGAVSGILFTDGHVIGITNQCDLQTLAALFTRNGGEPIDNSLIR
jgi:hypothetical protein